MRRTIETTLFVAVIGIFGAACMVGEAEDEPGTSDFRGGWGGGSFGKRGLESLNGLSTGAYWGNLTEITAALDHPLNKSNESKAVLMRTGGLELMDYAVRAGAEDQVPWNVHTLVWKGHAGLAQAWEKSLVRPEEKSWVLSYLLAHLNGFNAEVKLELHAKNNAQIGWTNPTGNEFIEGRFYNIIYQSDGIDTQLACACTGEGYDKLCTKPSEAMQLRTGTVNGWATPAPSNWPYPSTPHLQVMGSCSKICKTVVDSKGNKVEMCPCTAPNGQQAWSGAWIQTRLAPGTGRCNADD